MGRNHGGGNFRIRGGLREVVDGRCLVALEDGNVAGKNWRAERQCFVKG